MSERISFEDIEKVSVETKSIIKRKSAYSLPNNPTEAGYKADEIRKAFWQPIVETSGSVLAEIDRVVEEVNKRLGAARDLEKSIDDAREQLEAVALDASKAVKLEEQIGDQKQIATLGYGNNADVFYILSALHSKIGGGLDIGIGGMYDSIYEMFREKAITNVSYNAEGGVLEFQNEAGDCLGAIDLVPLVQSGEINENGDALVLTFDDGTTAEISLENLAKALKDAETSAQNAANNANVAKKNADQAASEANKAAGIANTAAERAFAAAEEADKFVPIIMNVHDEVELTPTVGEGAGPGTVQYLVSADGKIVLSGQSFDGYDSLSFPVATFNAKAGLVYKISKFGYADPVSSAYFHIVAYEERKKLGQGCPSTDFGNTSNDTGAFTVQVEKDTTITLQLEAFSGVASIFYFENDEYVLPKVTDATTGITLIDKYDFRLHGYNLISVYVPEKIEDYFTCVLSFVSDSAGTSLDYPAKILMSGTDCYAGIFSPGINKVYDIVIRNNGFNIRGFVSGETIS